MAEVLDSTHTGSIQRFDATLGAISIGEPLLNLFESHELTGIDTGQTCFAALVSFTRPWCRSERMSTQNMGYLQRECGHLSRARAHGSSCLAKYGEFSAVHLVNHGSYSDTCRSGSLGDRQPCVF